MEWSGVPGVAHVERIAGPACPPDHPARLLVEVPHGADRLAHYHATREGLRGALPDQLSHFFLANTDVGAWELGHAAALSFLAAQPREAVVLVRCLVPRTFIDCNRNLEADGAAGLTAGLPVYIEDPEDRAWLRGLHAAYVDLTDRFYGDMDDADGLALVPHTYAPRSVGIATVGHDIVDQLHAAWAPGVAETWPLRPEVDLITRDAEGQRLCPRGMVGALQGGLARMGITAAECGTYWLHPASRAATLSARHPGRLICLEARRDLVMQDWEPFAPTAPDTGRVAAMGAVLGAVLAQALPVG